MNPVFSTQTFWQPYLTCEPEDVSDEQLAAQLDSLGRDYVVREETVAFELCGEEGTDSYRVVEFPFTCGDWFSLVIDYQPNANGCDKNLFLVDRRSGTKHEMGWWDLARWHPYCLRLEEFDCLLEYWRQWDNRWKDQHLPLLLLCQFVGLPDEDTRSVLAARVEEAKLALGLPHVLDVPLYVPDGNYRWELDAELGWVFTSDDYCCYSIRNRPHADSDEGRFPFTAFREMLTGIQQ